MSEAHLPYAGTSGWSGSETSETRAKIADTTGVTGARQNAVRGLTRLRGEQGITVKELRKTLNLHHGQASSALTLLHKAGSLQRLTETRDRCKVYVTSEHVAGRETEPPGRTRATSRAVEEERERILREVDAMTNHGTVSLSRALIHQIVTEQ